MPKEKRYPDSVSGLRSQKEHSIGLILVHLPQKSTKSKVRDSIHMWTIGNSCSITHAIIPSDYNSKKKVYLSSRCILGINSIFSVSSQTHICHKNCPVIALQLILHKTIAINKKLPLNFHIFPNKVVHKQNACSYYTEMHVHQQQILNHGHLKKNS